MFDPSGFTTIAPTLFRYRTMADDLYKVAEPGYFDPVAAELGQGDTIFVNAFGTNAILFVTRNVEGRVQTGRPFAGSLTLPSGETVPPVSG